MRRHVLAFVGIAASAVVVGAAFLFYPAPGKPEPEALKPPAVRYMSNEQLARELAPLAQRFQGPNVMQIPAGFDCYSSETQRFRRIVVVCMGR